MSKNVKKKKSTIKKFKLDTSKMIPVIAIVEALVLVAISTFAWFYVSSNKKLSSGIITVQADSGLEIDFNDADKSSYIDIFNYVDKEKFYFEPATSVDGRNIFFPTSGTFGADQTEDIKFREGTVNDINSKYVNIDFELTNNSDQEMEVFLSNNSKFVITDDSDNQVNGKALRLALYNNDGNSGKVDSSFTNKFKTAESASSSASTDADTFTVYFFRNTQSNWGTQIHAYLYDSADPDTAYEIDGKSGIKFANSGYEQAWPGAVCSNVSGNLYSYTFSNPLKTVGVGEEAKQVTYTHPTMRRYDTIMFNDGGTVNKTAKLTITNGNYYHSGMSDGNTGYTNDLRTIYFLKPRDWKGVPKCAVQYSGTSKWYAEASTGCNMSLVSAGVYSYTFPVGEDISGTYRNYNKVKFIASGDTNQKSLLTDLEAYDPTGDKKPLYYFPDTDVSGVSSGTIYTVSDYSDSNLYFYNTKKWAQPYANINALADSMNESESTMNNRYKYTSSIPMIDLTGGLFYIEVPSVYMHDLMEHKQDTVGNTTIEDSGLADNCEVFFSDKKIDYNSDTGDVSISSITERTVTVNSLSNNIYKPGDVTTSIDSKTTYSLEEPKNYAEELSISANPYAVISPGVSTGFQRNSNPVKTINNSTGVPTEIVPTFASSFDDYIMGSGHEVFKVPSKKTVNMSMIIWLEGTDTHCTAANYAGKNINLYLEFSTLKQMDATDETYTYRFIDSTQEIWTSDTVTNAAGIEVNPVMQMYDATENRGYLMSPKSYASYDGKNKVRVWECLAPQTLLNSGHDFEFRRVNPYNEDEVWNYWDAGNITTYKADSFDVKTRVVSFTAFADGAPDVSYKAQFHNECSDSNIPEKSCGGVWGNVETQMLHVYDGRKDRNIEDKMHGDNDQELGYLFCHYEYEYPTSHEKVNLEYQGSTHYKYFYSFVVPSSIYTQNPKPQMTFPNYVKLKDYAINAEQQKGGKVSLRTVYRAGQLAGQFFELTTYHCNGDYESSYWGSDVIYVQAKNTLSRSFTNDFAFYQLYFHGTEGTSNFYSYMYENDSFKSSDSNNSFVAVVPSNGSYNSFHFEAALHGDHSKKIRYDLGTHAIHSSVDETTGLRLNIVQSVATGNDGRILTLDWDYAKILYKNSWSDGNYNGSNITVHYGNNGENTYGLVWMTNDSNSQPIYKAYVESNREDVYFQLNNKSGDYSRSANVIVKGKDAVIFEPKTDDPKWNSYKQFYTKEHITSYAGNNDQYDGTYNKISTTQNNNESWLEYTSKSNYDPRT